MILLTVLLFVFTGICLFGCMTILGFSVRLSTLTVVLMWCLLLCGVLQEPAYYLVLNLP